MANAIRILNGRDFVWGQKKGKLLSVDTTSRAKLDPRVSAYIEPSQEIPAGLILALTFQGEALIPFIVLSPASAARMQRYEAKIDQWFDIIIDEGEDKQDAADATQTALSI
jgi:hypothetical protein